MIKGQKNYFSKIEYLVIFLSLFIAAVLSFLTYYINYWPTDSFTPYIPTARHLFELPYLSQMHTVAVEGILRITMRAKEVLILGIAIMQKLLSDTESLYPNILFLILSNTVTSLSIYGIFRKLFNPFIGCITFLFYITCFWPYLYILQGAHQPLVLTNCSLAILLLLYSNGRKYLFTLAGLFIGLTLFSSPTSPLYFFYFLAAFIYIHDFQSRDHRKIQAYTEHAAWVTLGVVCIILLFTLPHPIKNLYAYMTFLNFSQEGNNFAIYREYLSHLIPMPEKLRGGGILWIWKYFLLIMPMLFILYLISLCLLLCKSLRNPVYLLLIFLSLTTPIFVELSGVAQFGRNYFSWLPGILLILAWMTNNVASRTNLKEQHKKIFLILLIIALTGHITYNGLLFFNDVLPSRMAATDIFQWLKKKNQKYVYVYDNHPRNINFVRFLNNPKYKEKIEFIRIKNIRQAQDGFILIPPVTGKSIFQECRLGDYLVDSYFIELYNSKHFSKYVAHSFKTMASSKIWNQEEEICTYSDLILKAISPEDRKKGLVYLLDASKLQKEWFSHFPKIMKFR